MKNIPALLIILLTTSTSCLAQGVFRNQTSSALEKVVQDYPKQFKNIRGEELSSAKGSTEYKSNIVIPGAVSTNITQTAAGQKQLVSWQSVVFAASDFNLAKTHFEEVFNQIKNTIIRAEGEKAVIVNAMYIDPSPDKTFTTIQFDLLPPGGAMQKVNIDLMLKNTGNQWKIILSVYDKDRKETETIAVK